MLKFFSVDKNRPLRKIWFLSNNRFYNRFYNPASLTMTLLIESRGHLTLQLLWKHQNKKNTSGRFDGEISWKIHPGDKLYEKFKLTRLPVDRKIFKEVRNTVQIYFASRKKLNFEGKLQANTTNRRSQKLSTNLPFQRSR